MIPPRIEKLFCKVAGGLFAALPRALPNKEKLGKCRIVSHRGEHDNRQILENTLAAFDRVRDRGVRGIELDVRWTRDLQPIVFHDANFQRMFGSTSMVNSMTMAEIRSEYPLVPSLEEVILNLMINARDAVEEQLKMGSNPTPPRVLLRTFVDRNDPEQRVKVEVIDSGVGIPQNLLTKVFDPFFTTKGPDKGTGLGLAISKSIIESFGGSICIQSAPGQGTTVVVFLPAEGARRSNGQGTYAAHSSR